VANVRFRTKYYDVGEGRRHTAENVYLLEHGGYQFARFAIEDTAVPTTTLRRAYNGCRRGGRDDTRRANLIEIETFSRAVYNFVRIRGTGNSFYRDSAYRRSGR